MSDKVKTVDRKKPPVRHWALALLLLSVTTWCVTLWLQKVHPDWVWVGYVKAFAEAACIGGLADWFAITALFRHPLGVPLPHTAILPNKQAQLARGVANFIGTNFLDAQMIGEQVRKYQVGERVADYAQTHITVAMIQERVPAALQAIIEKIPQTAPEQWLQAGQKSLVAYATGERMGSGAAKLIQWAQDEHTDRWLINRLAQALYDFCSAEDAAERARPWLSELIRKANDENATWWDKIKTSMTGQAVDWLDDWLIEKALAGGKNLAQRVQTDDAHPIHVWFSAQCIDWQRQLNDNPAVHGWLYQNAQAGLGSPMFTEWLGKMWQRIHGWLRDMSAGNTPQVQFIAQTLHDALSHQLAQPIRRAQLTDAAANISGRVLDTQQETIRAWMTTQLNAWSKERLNDALEEGIGNDLQYIRINGTLIGGLIGLGLYTLSVWLM